MTHSTFVLEGKLGAPVLVVANSLAANLTMWEPQMAEWKKSFQVLRFNYRGHSGTPSVGNSASMQDLADDVIELTDSLGIQEFHWVGLSLGAMLGIFMAAHYPKRVKSLVSACFRGSQTVESAAMWTSRIALVKEKGISPIVGPTAERWLTENFRSEHPGVDHDLRTMIANNEVDGYCACATAVKDYDLSGYITKVTCPTLLIGGQFDGGAPATDIEGLSKQITHGEFLALPGAHIANLECADAFTRASSKFLMKHIAK